MQKLHIAAMASTVFVSPIVLAGTSPSGFITNPHAEAVTSRSLFIDNNHPVIRSRGAELSEASFSGGGGSSSSPDRWRVENGYYVDSFHDDDALFHRARGKIELYQLGDAQRIQGLANNELLASATVTGPVEYVFTTTITFDSAVFQGDVDATFFYSTSMTSFGGPPSIIGDSGLIDLTLTSDSITYTSTGTLNPDGGETRFTISTDASLSLIIDAAGESGTADYTMITTATFRAVPAPGTAMVFLFGAGLGIKRRRT